jgi:hypothetical protein
LFVTVALLIPATVAVVQLADVRQLERMPRNTILIWFLLVLAVGILGVLVSYRRLALCSDYQTTTGTIDQTFPDNHQGFSFSYKVAGQSYDGDGYAGQIGRSFDSIRFGDTLTVFYYRQHPASCTLDSPRVLLVRTVGQIIAACAILPVIGIFVIRNRKPPNTTLEPTPTAP